MNIDVFLLSNNNPVPKNSGSFNAKKFLDAIPISPLEQNVHWHKKKCPAE